jgi:hypothetical protein
VRSRAARGSRPLSRFHSSARCAELPKAITFWLAVVVGLPLLSKMGDDSRPEKRAKRRRNSEALPLAIGRGGLTCWHVPRWNIYKYGHL